MLVCVSFVDIKGKHIFVTGAGRRLGRALSEAFLPHQVKLSAHYRKSMQEVTELKTKGATVGSEVLPVQADLADVPSLQTAVKNAVLKFGVVDLLINCASDFYPTPLKTVTESQWDSLMSVNLKGQFFLAQAIAVSMKQGLIINFGDVNGEHPMKNYTPYVLSKAGMLMMTKNLAKELSPHIRVNSISPGPVLLPESYTAEQRAKSIDRTLLKRLGSPDDIVAAAFFLIENDYVTGLNLVVDGGRSLL